MFYKTNTTTLFVRTKILNKENTFFLIENLNLTVKKGSTTIIKGKNGSGKTTLLKTLNF